MGPEFYGDCAVRRSRELSSLPAMPAKWQPFSSQDVFGVFPASASGFRGLVRLLRNACFIWGIFSDSSRGPAHPAPRRPSRPAGSHPQVARGAARRRRGGSQASAAARRAPAASPTSRRRSTAAAGTVCGAAQTLRTGQISRVGSEPAGSSAWVVSVELSSGASGTAERAGTLLCRFEEDDPDTNEPALADFPVSSR